MDQKKRALIKPYSLNFGDTIGIFTPSWPAHVILRDKYELGIENIKKLGFKIVEGDITKQCKSDGYRSADGSVRAREFMSLIHNKRVKCLMATIGGSNSASMIPYLDFEAIRESRKLICGYSDITSLHLAILAYSQLSTLYGPSLIPIFGEYPQLPEFSVSSFLDSSMDRRKYPLNIIPPKEVSYHFIDATLEGWKKIQRQWEPNSGWRTLIPGKITAPLVIGDLETLLSAAGTSYFPDLNHRILIVEEMHAPYSKEERLLRQLQLMGVFNQISGLIISKAFFEDKEGSKLTYDALVLEIVGQRNYPIVSNFDCGHTFPMLSLGQNQLVTLNARSDHNVQFILEEPIVSKF